MILSLFSVLLFVLSHLLTSLDASAKITIENSGTFVVERFKTDSIDYDATNNIFVKVINKAVRFIGYSQRGLNSIPLQEPLIFVEGFIQKGVYFWSPKEYTWIAKGAYQNTNYEIESKIIFYKNSLLILVWCSRASQTQAFSSMADTPI